MTMSNLPKIIAIMGPTASGKTDLSLRLAKKYNGEIIATDSRTLYKGMDIGTAKPEGQKLPGAQISADKVESEGIHSAKVKLQDLFSEKPYLVEGVKHWGVDILNPDESFSVSEFKDYAEKHIDRIISEGKLPILVGGTGLYFQAIIDQLEFADVPPDEELRTELKFLSLEDLQDRVKDYDVTALNYIDENNPRRLIRAIELMKGTGEKWLNIHKKGQQKYDALQLMRDIDREDLYARIDKRVDAMVADGLVDEVRALKSEYGCDAQAMSGIGYRQVCDFLDGKARLSDAVEEVKKATRNYAKRQLTWFRKVDGVKLFKLDEEALDLVDEFLDAI